jgi:hypothetical protein
MVTHPIFQVVAVMKGKEQHIGYPFDYSLEPADGSEWPTIRSLKVSRSSNMLGEDEGNSKSMRIFRRMRNGYLAGFILATVPV